MTTCLEKSCSIGLLCVSSVNVYQSVCVIFPFWFGEWDVGFDCINSWPRGYKTFFMLNSTEHEIFPANKQLLAF